MSSCKLCPICGHEVVESEDEGYDWYCPYCKELLQDNDCEDYFEQSAYDFEESLAVEKYYERKYSRED